MRMGVICTCGTRTPQIQELFGHFFDQHGWSLQPGPLYVACASGQDCVVHCPVYWVMYLVQWQPTSAIGAVRMTD